MVTVCKLYWLLQFYCLSILPALCQTIVSLNNSTFIVSIVYTTNCISVCVCVCSCSTPSCSRLRPTKTNSSQVPPTSSSSYDVLQMIAPVNRSHSSTFQLIMVSKIFAVRMMVVSSFLILVCSIKSCRCQCTTINITVNSVLCRLLLIMYQWTRKSINDLFLFFVFALQFNKLDRLVEYTCAEFGKNTDIIRHSNLP